MHRLCKMLMLLCVHVTSVLFLVWFTLASIGITRFYSNCLFLCALVLAIAYTTLGLNWYTNSWVKQLEAHTHTHTLTEQRCLWFKRLLNYNRMHVCLLLFCMGASCTQRIKNLSTTGRWVNFLQHCYSVYRCIAIRCTVECQLFEHVRTEPRLVTMNIP